MGYQGGGEGAAGKQHLIRGPWPHAINSSAVGELVIPNAELETLWEYEENLMRACLLADPEAQATLVTIELGPTALSLTPGIASGSA